MGQVLLLYPRDIALSPWILEEVGKYFEKHEVRPLEKPESLPSDSLFVVVLGDSSWTENHVAQLAVSLNVNPLTVRVFPCKEVLSLSPENARILWRNFLHRLTPPKARVAARAIIPVRKVFLYPREDRELCEVFRSIGIPAVSSLPSALVREGVDFVILPEGEKAGAVVLLPSPQERPPVTINEDVASTGKVVPFGTFLNLLPSLSLRGKLVVVLVPSPHPYPEEWERVFALSHLASEGVQIAVLTENVFVAGEDLEGLYRNARNSGILFEKVALQDIVLCPTPDMRQIRVEYTTEKDAFPVSLQADWLVFVPERTVLLPPFEQVLVNDCRVSLKIRENPNGLPFSTTIPGVFVAPPVRREFASFATVVCRYLEEGTVEEVGRLVIDEERCALCLTCLRSCPSNALVIEGAMKRHRIEVNATLCRRCGVCASLCPAKAITLHGFTVEDFQPCLVWGDVG